MYYCYVYGDGKNGYLNYYAWMNESYIRILQRDGYDVEITSMQEDEGI